MTSQLDTSGAVAPVKDGTDPSPGAIYWCMLPPFTQGYVEALFASENDPAVGGFSDLAPETLARIIADCEGGRVHQTDDNERAAGRSLWNRRQAGNSPFPPLTVQLGDDGKVRFAA